MNPTLIGAMDQLLGSVDRLEFSLLGSSGIHECRVHVKFSPFAHHYTQRADETVGAFVVRCISDALHQREASRPRLFPIGVTP